jgi:hypothetical protein
VTIRATLFAGTDCPEKINFEQMRAGGVREL